MQELEIAPQAGLTAPRPHAVYLSGSDDKIAQVALFFGANDMGSTMIEENVVASAGVDNMLPEAELRRLIETAGFTPRQRDCYYNLL